MSYLAREKALTLGISVLAGALAALALSGLIPWWAVLVAVAVVPVLSKPELLMFVAPWTLVAWVRLFSVAGSNFTPHDLVVVAMYGFCAVELLVFKRAKVLQKSLWLLALAWLIFLPGAVAIILMFGPHKLLPGLAIHAKRFALPSIYPLFLVMFLKKRHVLALMTDWWAVGVLAMMMALLQFFSVSPQRAIGIFYNPNTAGAWAVLTVLLSLWGLKSGKKWFGLGLLAGFAGLAVSGSRSWFLGLIFALVGWMLVAGKKKLPVGLAAMGVLFGVLHFAALDQGLLQRWRPLAQQGAEAPPAVMRLTIYRLGLIMIKKSPLVGYGPGGHRAVSASVYRSMDDMGKIGSYVYYSGMGVVDNLWLQHTAEFGLVGTFLLLIILWIGFKASVGLRSQKWKGLFLSFGLALVPVSMFQSPLLSYWVTPAFWLLTGLALLKSQEEAK